MMPVNTHLHPPLDLQELSALATAARATLTALPPEQATLTYQELARALGLRPPHSIHRVVQALEHVGEAHEGELFADPEAELLVSMREVRADQANVVM